jgi:hypothetical protein
MVRLARLEARREPGQAALNVAAVAVPVGFAAFISPAFISPTPVSIMFLAVLVGVIALSVGAVLATSTKRRVVRYARLSAIGADPGQVRALLMLESAPATIVGFLAGFTVGTVLSYWFGLIGILVDDGGQPVALIIAAAAAAIGLATAAGLWFAVRPAAEMALKAPVVESLAARAPEPEPSPNQGRHGLGLIVAALTMATVSAGYVTLVMMVIAVFVGLHLAMGPALIALERRSGLLPRSVRLAARNGARNRTRLGRLTLACLAAVTLAVMAVAGIRSDSPDNPASGYSWPMDQRFILLSAQGSADTEAFIGDIVTIEDRVAIQLVAGNVVRVQGRSNSNSIVSMYQVELALLSPELQAILDPDPATIAALERGDVVNADGVGLPISIDGGRTVLSAHTTRLGFGSTRIVSSRLAFEPAVPQGLISPQRADELGLRRSVGEVVLLVADRPLTESQRNELAAAERSVLVGDSDRYERWTEWLATGIAALFLITFGLIGAALSGLETEQEVKAMIANGANPSIRRWFRAIQSGIQLGLAGLVGVPLGLVLFWAVTRSDPSVPDPIFPWETMIALGIGVPIAVVALVAATTSSGSPAVSRRAMA